MQRPDHDLPRQGCPFAGRPSAEDDVCGPACVGQGRCGECERAAALIPLPLPAFRVLGFLASGYYADVYLAVEVASGDAVALKVYADTPPKRLAWEHERAALAALAHPRIPRLRGAFLLDGWHVVAMDLVVGVDVRSAVERAGPLTADRAVAMGLEVAEALTHFAALGWTYRDLHPRNVHVETPVGTMLLDFDNARPPGWPAAPAGRIGYRAPELERPGEVTSACDLYGLAGCVHFALTAEDPPNSPGPLGLQERLTHHRVLSDVLDRCRRDDPNERPAVEYVEAAFRASSS